MTTVALKIDGHSITVEAGTTILDAARRLGIEPAGLCSHPFLSLVDACGTALVEDVEDDWATLVSACCTTVRDGMEIETDSEILRDVRAGKRELLLATCAGAEPAGERVTDPLIRNDRGELEPCSADEALAKGGDGLAAVRDKDGGNAVGVVCGAFLTNEEYYLAQRLARAALSTNNIDNLTGPWQLPVYEGLSTSLGMGAMTNSVADITQAGAILVLGAGAVGSHTVAAIRSRKMMQPDLKLIVAQPKESPMADVADLDVRPKEGGEASLIVGLMKVVVDSKLYDEEFLESHTQDLDVLLRSLEKIGLDEAAERSGVSEETLKQAAELYASGKPGSLVYAINLGSPPADVSFYRMCAALQCLLGSLGVEGSGVNIVGCAGNWQGAGDFGALPKYLPGYRPVGQKASRKMAAKHWGVKPTAKPGLSWPEMIEAAARGKLKALYLVGLDPFDVGLNADQVGEALGKLEFLLVQTPVLGDVSKYAHVVLPGGSIAEKTGTTTSNERRVQRVNLCLGTAGDQKSDFETINALVGVLNPELKLAGPEAAFHEAVQFIKELGDITVDEIGGAGVQWPIDASGQGTERLGLPEKGSRAKFKFYAARLSD